MKTILLATDVLDGGEYLARRPELKPALIVTPRSLNAARGCIGPVYATPAARQHDHYARMVEQAAPCAATIDLDRVA